MNAHCSTSETVCLQCGDIGFTNAFVYCIKCLKFCVHRYCLDVLPELVDEFVRWVCDSCQMEALNQPAGCNNKTIQRRTRDHIYSKQLEKERFEQGSSQRLEEQKINRNLISNDNLSADAPSKESMKMRSAITFSTVKNEQHRFRNNSSKIPNEKCANIGISDCAKLACDSALSMDMNKNKATEKKDQHHVARKLCKSGPEPGALSHLSCKSSLGSSKKKKTNMSSEANLEEQRQRAPRAQHLKEDKRPNLKTRCSEGRGISISNDSNKNRESKVCEDRTFVSYHKNNIYEGLPQDSTISSMVDCNIHAAPLKMPIWRGSFNIWNKNNDILDGLMAHMSSRASQKVYEEASQFQLVLHLEMLPKSDVWPKSFETSEPSGGNIALFFFPSDMRSEPFFDHFVDEMVHKGLALRAIVRNAELLVFTSMELPLPYWRFQGKYYIWGVFKQKPEQALLSQSCSREPRYNPITRKDRLHGTDSPKGKIPVTTKKVGAQSPLSPLSYCSSYSLHTSSTKNSR